MDLKNEFLKEKTELLDVKKPYETAAFVIFSIFILQQLFYVIVNIADYIKRIGVRNDFVDTGGATYGVSFSFNAKAITPNIPVFVGRVLGIDPTKGIWVFMAFLFLVLWYVLIFLLVWSYCQKHKFAKWTWTTLIVFGPTSILFVPTYLIYAIYVFRPHVFRFIRRGVDEYKKYNENYEFKEENKKVTKKAPTKKEPSEKVPEEK